MSPDQRAEILSLDGERRDLDRRIIKTAGWVRVADEDGSPMYASARGREGIPLHVAVAIIVTAARVERRDEQQHQVSEAGGGHAATVAPLAPRVEVP